MPAPLGDNRGVLDPGPARGRRLARGLVAASLALSALAISVNDGPYGDLGHLYTDHLHHAYATWVFLHRGFDVYREPLARSSAGVAYRQAIGVWGQMPVNYPPGVFAVFLPPALLGAWLPVSRAAFGKLCVLYLLVLAHLALYAFIAALEATEPGGRAFVAVVAWMILLRLGLQGLFDSTFIACGALALRALALRRPAVALRWLAGAVLLHYRAVALAPVGAAALWQLWAARKTGARPPWRDLALVAAATAFSLWTFLLMYPVARGYLATLPPPLLRRPESVQLWIVIAASVATAAVVFRLADWVAGVLVLTALFLAVTDIYLWWHGAILLFAPLAVGAFARARAPSAARALLLGWLFLMQPLGFDQSPSEVFVDLARQLRLPPG